MVPILASRGCNRLEDNYPHMRQSQVNCIHSGRAGGSMLGIVSRCRKLGAGQGHGMGQLDGVSCDWRELLGE